MKFDKKHRHAARPAQGRITSDTAGDYIECPNCGVKWLLTRIDRTTRARNPLTGRIEVAELAAWHCTYCNTIINLE